MDLNLYKALLYSSDNTIKTSNLKDIDNINTKIVKKVHDWMTSNNIKYQIFGGEYHYKLYSIKSKPYLIYYIGDINLLNNRLIGIVGPRFHSLYSQDFINYFLSNTKHNTYSTISGMADGVDTICHKLSIQNGIKTIAVIGGGFEYYLNFKKSDIISEIIQSGGLVISEFKFNQKPCNYTFPQRNRIVSGLSDLLIIPEAGKGSGSLITADFSIATGKPVYGLMGNIHSHFSYGINEYISNKKINSIYDVDLFINQIFPKNNISEQITLDTIHSNILDYISQNGPTKPEVLVKQFSLKYDSLLGIISYLELNSLVKQDLTGFISLNK